MRYLPLIIAALPVPLWAADIPAQSSVRAVTLFPQGATITREVSFSAPAGQHRLILGDLPPDTPLSRVRVSLGGALMGSVSARNDDLPPTDPDVETRQTALRTQIEALEQAILDHDARIRLIRTEVEAAEARVAFLRQLGSGDGVAALGVEALRDLSGLVGDETLSALKSAHMAQERVKGAERDKAETQEALDRLRALLKSLEPGTSAARAMLAVDFSAQAATEATATITYTIEDAGWTPVYDMRLARDSGALRIERGAFIHQSSGENWDEVALTLSTLRPSEQTAPSEIWPWQRWLFDPEEMQPKQAARSDGALGTFSDAHAAEPVAEAALVRQAEADFDGLSVSYDYPGRLSVANRADRVRIALGALEAQVDLVAQAVPLVDGTAFLMADFANETDEVILPSAEAMFYLDGRFVGQRSVDLIPAGGMAELSFGPIEGLRLSRDIIKRSEGDRGVISKSNQVSEHARISIENLTGESWPVRLIDRVPYSEQEDLRITWSSDLEVTEQDLEARRGVLAWSFDLPAGGRQVINLTHRIDWPEGKVLQ